MLTAGHHPAPWHTQQPTQARASRQLAHLNYAAGPLQLKTQFWCERHQGRKGKLTLRQENRESPRRTHTFRYHIMPKIVSRHSAKIP